MDSDQFKFTPADTKKVGGVPFHWESVLGTCSECRGAVVQKGGSGKREEIVCTSCSARPDENFGPLLAMRKNLPACGGRETVSETGGLE